MICLQVTRDLNICKRRVQIQINRDIYLHAKKSYRQMPK